MSVVAHSIIGQVTVAAIPRAQAAVAKTTLDIQTGAQARSRVDLGFMKAGWTAQIAGLHGEVHSGADYTIYHEFGTVKMSAQPMATPAAEEARGPFYAAMGQVFKP